MNVELLWTIQYIIRIVMSHLDLTQPSVLARVNIVAAQLTNICNKTMCALLSSARLGDALPRLQLWTVAGLELGGNVTRARVTPTLRRSGYTLSREERAGHRERGETRRRAGGEWIQHTSLPRPPALTKTSYKI